VDIRLKRLGACRFEVWSGVALRPAMAFLLHRASSVRHKRWSWQCAVLIERWNISFSAWPGKVSPTQNNACSQVRIVSTASTALRRNTTSPVAASSAVATSVSTVALHGKINCKAHMYWADRLSSSPPAWVESLAV